MDYDEDGLPVVVRRRRGRTDRSDRSGRSGRLAPWRIGRPSRHDRVVARERNIPRHPATTPAARPPEPRPDPVPPGPRPDQKVDPGAPDRIAAPTTERTGDPLTRGHGSRGSLTRRLVAAMGIVLIALALGSLLVGIGIVAAGHRIDRIDVTFPGSGTAATITDGDSETWLILGTDGRDPNDPEPVPDADGSGTHADVVLVAHRVGDQVSVVSIPRDLVVVDGGGAPHRLTLTYANGDQFLIDTVCNSLGLSFDHLVVVAMAGFPSVVNAAGGIVVDLDAPLLDVAAGIDLPSGTHLVDGRVALGLVRSRNSGSDGTDPDRATLEAGTLRRASMAPTVLSALADRVTPPWRHPIRAARTAWALLDTVTVDQNTELGDMRSLMSIIGGSEMTVLPTEPLAGGEDSPVPRRVMSEGADAVLRSVGAVVDGTTGRPVACDRR